QPEFPYEAPFSITLTLSRIIAYTLPALALLWFVVLDKNDLPFLLKKKPDKPDLLTFTIGLAGLVTIGFSISIILMIISRYYGLPIPPRVSSPDNLIGNLVMILSCLGTGYLEETFFRYYLLIKYENHSMTSKIIFSTLLFSLSHAHDGPWGIINAMLASIFLSLLFLRYRSLHGIALSHGFYNIFVYTISAIL
ncbi:MAG: CPBP family intramembrane metalloprotease, partial [Treponema sp.]|nr:CPBP family intramembrane metalloprotease [Treponema sp.]